MAQENPDFRRDDDGNPYRWVEDLQSWVPVEQVNPAQAAMVGAGSTLSGWGNSIAQMLGQGGEDAYQQQMADRALVEATVGQTNPVATGLGNALPALATAPVTGFGGALLMGGATGALDPARDIEERMVNAGFGTILSGGGYGLGKVAGRVVSAIRGMGDDGMRMAMAAGDDVGGGLGAGAGGGGRGAGGVDPFIQNAEKLGFRIRAGDRLNDPLIKQFELGASRSPYTAPYYAKFTEDNQKLLGDAVGDALGVEPARMAATQGKLTEEVLASRRGRLSDYFEGLNNMVKEVSIGSNMADRIKSVDSFKKLRGLSGGEVFSKLDDGLITGQEYKTIRSTLTDFASREGGTVAFETSRLIDDLDNAVGAVLPEGELGRFAKARQQWQLLEAVEGGKALRADGTLNIDTMNNRIKSMVGNRVYHEGDFSTVSPEVQRLVNKFKIATDPRLRPSVGTSGTAEGLLASQAVDDVMSAMRGDAGAIPRVISKVGGAKAFQMLMENNPRALVDFLNASPEAMAAFGQGTGTIGREGAQSVAREFDQ